MTRTGPLVVIGDALLDRDVNGTASRLCPDAPAPVLDDLREIRRPGGAALAALLAARDGSQVVLITPIGNDPASAIVRVLLEPHVTVVPMPLDGPLPDKARYRAGGQTLLRADGPAGRPGPASREAAEAIASGGTLLVSDYGRGTAADTTIRAALARRAARVPLVWDPHPRGPKPVPGTRLATPNHAEARAAAGLDPTPAGPPAGGPGPAGPPAGGSALVSGPVLRSAAEAAARLLSRWPVDGVAVTLGPHGTLLAQGSPAPLIVPARRVQAPDTCGAGDTFAAAAAVALSHGALPSEAVVTATRTATDFLAAGGVGSLRSATAVTGSAPADRGVSTDAGAPADTGGPADGSALTDPAVLAGRVHAAGGTVVAAGGCFDVLHAGHVSLLQAARSLGDCLIVCLNSDESVRRLKGEGRPLNPAADRVALLSALQCVDAVLVFEEDTPLAVLQRLRPDVWVKGGDYEGQVLPETDLLSTWGGQAVTVPYLAGRSTTRLQSAGAAAALGSDWL
jgi:D-beta-D-heptose 7-phosphate kinase / D-beta-D-heptose 1-phosphate adenosyltransferase